MEIGMRLPLAALAALMVGCSCGDSGSSKSNPNTITIQSFAYSPANLSVKPGTTITVVNRDSDQHSVTSTTSDTSFTPGAVKGVSFDTGSFNGTTTFTLSASAPPGTVVSYFCVSHGSMMGHGTITVVSP
jgi:plastocyanin